MMHCHKHRHSRCILLAVVFPQDVALSAGNIDCSHMYFSFGERCSLSLMLEEFCSAGEELWFSSWKTLDILQYSRVTALMQMQNCSLV